MRYCVHEKFNGKSLKGEAALQNAGLTLKSIKTDAANSHAYGHSQDAEDADDFCDARSFASNSSFYTSAGPCSPGCLFFKEGRPSL